MSDGDRHVFEKTFQYEKSAVSIAVSGNTELASIDVAGRKKLCFQFNNATGGGALDNFDVLVRPTENAAFIDITPANWASLAAAEYRFKYSNGNLAAQAANSDGYFEMDVSGLERVQILASANTTISTVTPKYSLQ